MAESASSQNLPSTSQQQSFHQTICLETHPWHAINFHMIDKWGYKIPHYSNDKNHTVDANYKAITKDCLLQDISYYTCIEIVGEKNYLEATLKEHCDPRKTFAAKMYTNGEKEGTVMFFRKNGYPQFPIGNVNFFWKLSETNIKTIWIWVHPAFYSDFLSEIISSFEFKRNNARQDRTDISHNLNNLYINDAGCEMRVLKYAFNRFRLSGPAALSVLQDALRLPSLTEQDLNSENCPVTEEQNGSLNVEKLDTSADNNVSVQPVQEMVIDENEKDNKDLTVQDLGKKMWHTKYYEERDNKEVFKIQELMWECMKVLGSPTFLLSNMVIGLTVLDPRSYLPERRTSHIILPPANLNFQLPPDINRSPIWDAQIRHIVSNSCTSTNTTDKFMGATSMSNNPNFNKDAVGKIPILLIQKPAVAPLGLGSRIDIIIPSRWAMAFWMALLMRSPLVGGLRETKLVVFESLESYVSDINDPDTPAYMREALTRKEELTDEYFSHSSDQIDIILFNFIKFGIRSPFFCDWKNLTKGWSNVEDFYVLRDLRLLTFLRMELKIVERKNASSESTVQESKFNFQEFDEYQNCLVQVKLSIVNTGMPNDFAIICIPTCNDLRSFEKDKNYDGPVEKLHVDPNEESRNKLRRLHIMELEQVSGHGVKRKKTSEDNVSPGELDVIHDEINDAELSKHQHEMISYYAKEIRKLYLPESTEVRHSCGREVMGYVTMGGYSFLRAEMMGIGYVALPSLLEIIRKGSNIVLVRNTEELQYRLARLEILVDIKCAS